MNKKIEENRNFGTKKNEQFYTITPLWGWKNVFILSPNLALKKTKKWQKNHGKEAGNYDGGGASTHLVWLKSIKLRPYSKTLPVFFFFFPKNRRKY